MIDSIVIFAPWIAAGVVALLITGIAFRNVRGSSAPESDKELVPVRVRTHGKR